MLCNTLSCRSTATSAMSPAECKHLFCRFRGLGRSGHLLLRVMEVVPSSPELGHRVRAAGGPGGAPAGQGGEMSNPLDVCLLCLVLSWLMPWLVLFCCVTCWIEMVFDRGCLPSLREQPLPVFESIQSSVACRTKICLPTCTVERKHGRHACPCCCHTF